jgi:cellulose synthase/poly-beta-1,6-N-acetylglucosamine synthase-like glycosyltransferase
LVKLSAIICAYNEERMLPAAIHSLFAQTRVPDEIIVVNNASTDDTRAVAAGIPGVRVIDEPDKGLVKARAAGYRAATGDVLLYIDADCRAPVGLVAGMERRFLRSPGTVAVTGPYRFYDWDWVGTLGARVYDYTLAPLAHVTAQHVLRIGAVLYGGNFAVRRTALAAIGGFDTTIEFHGEDTNLGRRLAAVGAVELVGACYIQTSARRYLALGRGKVFRLYVRNFWWETIHHRPKDLVHEDVRR